MSEETRLQTLSYVLIATGLVFLVGVYPLMKVWPAGWQWIPNQYEYEQMIVGVYAVLGVYLLIASQNPREHRSLIGFTAWSSLVHGGIMAAQAYVDPKETGHFYGDVPALLIVGVVLLWLLPSAQKEAPATSTV